MSLLCLARGGGACAARAAGEIFNRCVHARAALPAYVRARARTFSGTRTACALPSRPEAAARTLVYKKQVKGSVSAMLPVPDTIPAPPYAKTGRVPDHFPPPQVHDKQGVEAMRRASAVARDVLSYACSLVQPGITTDALDRLVHERCVQLGVYPSPLNYSRFPKSLCTSINEVVCHGIPDEQAVIAPGDLVKLDVSVYTGGVHGDTCRTVIAGGSDATDAAGRQLAQVTKDALWAAIGICGPGVPVRNVGALIEKMARAHGLSVVESYAGHGIGSHFHTEPLVFHMNNNSSALMRPGMTFTIEPMLVEGKHDLLMWRDDWTVVTKDGKRCAQFEHTLLITEHGVEVLTKYDDGML